ncbi:MAG: histidinol-phosphatase [Pseudomonadota bacterium]
MANLSPHADIFSDDEITDLSRFAETLANAAGQAALPYFRNGAEPDDKSGGGSDFDPVTVADRAAEDAMRALIENTYPAHGILGEERPEKPAESRFRWVLDPIDGTRAFICGAPTWTTLVALNVDERPVLSAIRQPFTDETWIGAPGGGVYKRGATSKSLQTRRSATLDKAHISTTDPSNTAYFNTAEADAFASLAARARVARFSLDAYAYALLALGQIDLVVEAGLAPYDVHALAPVVKSAGGLITDWRGQEAYSGRIVAAANAELHAEALDVLKNVD